MSKKKKKKNEKEIEPLLPGEIFKSERMVKHKDARLLREALAGIFEKVAPPVKQRILTTLRAYADALESYCTCEDRSWVSKENRYACLDCGKRHIKPPANTKPYQPSEPPLEKLRRLRGEKDVNNDN